MEDIATDSEGRLLMLENVGDSRVGAREHQPHQIRRVEKDGSLTTVVSADEVDDLRSGNARTWFDLPDGNPALNLPLYGATRPQCSGISREICALIEVYNPPEDAVHWAL